MTIEKDPPQKPELSGSAEMNESASTRYTIEELLRLGALAIDERDYQKAEKFYVKAGEMGSPIAYHALGITAQEDEDDIEKAKELFVKAGEMGYEQSYFRLAEIMVEEGDIEKAKELYRKTDSELDEFSLAEWIKMRLGMLAEEAYNEGKIEKAKELLEKAAQMGSLGARKALDALESADK